MNNLPFTNVSGNNMCDLFGNTNSNKYSRYSRYSSVSDMLDVLGWTPLSQRRQEARLILFYKIINSLAQVPFKGVLVEAYKGTRRKHNMKFRQIGHTTTQYGGVAPLRPRTI